MILHFQMLEINHADILTHLYLLQDKATLINMIAEILMEYFGIKTLKQWDLIVDASELIKDKLHLMQNEDIA